MKTKIIFLIFISCFSILAAEDSSPIVINLVTTNDLHGVLGKQTAGFMNPEYPPSILGMSAMYKYVEDLRADIKNEEGLLLLDGGNFYQGHPMGLADSGRTVIEWMNKMKYDALTPGSYDFILGQQAVVNRAKQAEFPFLGSNIECDNCQLPDELIKPYIIKEIQDVKVGILGVIASAIEDQTLKENIVGIDFGREVAAMKYWIPEMKKNGAEVIIILSSNGVPWDREEEYELFLDSLDTGWQAPESALSALQMGHYAQGADIIVTGGNSKGYPLPWYDPYSHVYVFQNYGGGTEFGHIKLKINPESHIFIGYETVIDGRVSQTLLADDFTPDPDIYQWIEDAVTNSLDELYADNDWYSNTSKLGIPLPIKTKFDRNDYAIPSINQPDMLEVVTWNCEMFPANNESTITMLSEAINDLDADIYAFQEIRYPGWFSKLMAELPQYSYIISKQSSFMDQAIVYKTDQVKFIQQTEPFADDDYNYAGRPPIRGDFMIYSHNSWVPISILNLHMKCCDSGLLRRQGAVRMLQQYLSDEMDKGFGNFIVLGDWNDDLKDEDNAHCFHPFLNDDRFHFPTWRITHDLSMASYPKEPYVSFLDHILVSEQLLPSTAQFDVSTIMVEDYLGSYDIYEANISDHRPVMLRFNPLINQSASNEK
ncbi:MAG: hypothetical protein HN729_05135 [Candidatus Marinimicrobia bacterium]|jgi:exonuclease III|nr:hypothetical protein [Candidatus Neomarinimicrobiota bacterium]MBT3634608.1 hypothetical protein [Candidatus Neomarinimicrobiota bacterium]MBT3683311.1 hypothetical protein [Candidatus Neomarinimicrobiota bacterium]MBT3760262.1 hypothetical protein [Candidatus Neomarinimicrobiota bacterium]MBT3896357.1 hypothetical protein [Candidatus Neomarinimicrobiota bacterium]